MKNRDYQKRLYRCKVCSGRLFKAQVSVFETDLQILTNDPLDKDFVIARIRDYRDQIEEYANYRDKRFLVSLKPVRVQTRGPRIVRQMAAAGKKADVGPMAAVAGAIAQAVGRDLLRKGYRDVIVENGGDIFLKVGKPVTIGVYAGSSKLSGKLRLRIDPGQTPMGICTSSGTVGHSLSFGKADAVTIFARDAALADAVATATANRINCREDMGAAVAFSRGIKGVRAALIILGNNLASWGALSFAKQ